MRNWNIRDEDTIYEIMRLYENIKDDFDIMHKEQTENYNITVSKKQWDNKIRKVLQEKNRPAFSYNLVRVILNVLIGIERDNRKDIIVSARNSDDEQLSSVMTKVLKYYLYHSGFNQARRRVFYDKIIAKYGVYHIGWRYEGSDDEFGKLFIEAVDPREMLWDSTFDDRYWSKASFVMRRHKMTLEEIINTYALDDEELRNAIQEEASLFYRDPDKGKWISRKLKQIFEAVYDTAFSNSMQDNTNNYSWWDATNNKFDILELHEQRMQKSILVNNPIDNKLIDITDEYIKLWKQLNEYKVYDGYTIDNEIIQMIKDKYGLMGAVNTELIKQRYVTAICPAFRLKLNEQPYPINSKYYVYIPDYCYDVHSNLREVQSVIDDIKDTQLEFNKARSLIIELIGRYVHRGYIIDENAIKGYEKDWADNTIGGIKRVRSGYFNFIKPEEMMLINPELLNMPKETLQLIKVITNADDEIRGVRAPGVTSGKHFIAKEQRQARSFTIILENRDDSIKAVTELALNFIQKYASTQQIIRITSQIDKTVTTPETIRLNAREFITKEDGTIEIRKINDISSLQYDVEIVEDAYSSSSREERFIKLSEIFNATIRLNPRKAELMLPIIIKNIGLSEANEILQVWENEEKKQQLAMQQSQMAQQQLGQAITQLNLEGLKADVDSKKLDNVQKELQIRQQASQPYQNYLVNNNGANNVNTRNNL